MLVLGRSQVEALLDVDALIDALASAMADLSAGHASAPDRVAALVPEREGFLAAMPGFVPSAGVLMSKLVSLFPHNAGTRLPTHQALIVVFDPDTGEPAALLDGSVITAARTGACSALSVRLLAREDATVLAILGTGVQARSHARAICRVRPIRQIRVAGPDPAKAAALAEELSSVLETEVCAASSYAEALDGADIAAACGPRCWRSPPRERTATRRSSRRP
ncbi:ornithine cyclodeaminase family protein, partial [Streptomyces sp. NPDC049099]